MTCPDCKTARTYTTFRQFDLSCIWCGARLVQQIGTLHISPNEMKVRRLVVLADWEKYGHDREQLRLLAKGPHALGPVEIAVSAPRKKVKRR